MKKEGTKNLFNYNAYKNLIETINVKAESPEDCEELHEMVELSLKSCLDYVQAVDAMELAMPRIMATCKGAEFRDRLSGYDHSRRVSHDAAIAQARIMNRLCKMYEIEPVCTADLDDRIQVADYCIDVVTTAFNYREQ